MRSLFAVMGEWSLLSGASKHSSAPSLRDTLRRRNSDLLRLPDKVPELGTVCRVKTSDVRGRYEGVTWALRGRAGCDACPLWVPLAHAFAECLDAVRPLCGDVWCHSPPLMRQAWANRL